MGCGLSSLDATDLGGTAIAAALERAEVAPEQVEHVVYGQVAGGPGQIPRGRPDQGGIPRRFERDREQGLRLRLRSRHGRPAVAPATSTWPWPGVWSRCRGPYLLAQARFGYQHGDAKALDA